MTKALASEMNGESEDKSKLGAETANNSVDIMSLKNGLLQTIGENSKEYWQLLKKLLHMQLTKPEFDKQVGTLLSADMVRQHNKFIYALLHNALCPQTPNNLPDAVRGVDGGDDFKGTTLRAQRRAEILAQRATFRATFTSESKGAPGGGQGEDEFMVSGRPQRSKRLLRRDDSESQIQGGEFESAVVEGTKRQKVEEKFAVGAKAGEPAREEPQEEPPVPARALGSQAQSLVYSEEREEVIEKEENEEIMEEESDYDEDENVDTQTLVDMLEGEDEEPTVCAPLGIGFRSAPPPIQRSKQPGLLERVEPTSSHPSERHVHSGRVGERELITLEGRPLEGVTPQDGPGGTYDLPTQSCIRARMQVYS